MGTIEVVKTTDWFTPFRVAIKDGTGRSREAKFQSAAQAQRYAVATEARTGFTLVYTDERVLASDDSTRVESREPRTVSLDEFKARVPKICEGCREARPLAEFREVFHTNRATNPGRQVMHGYADRCRGCEGADA